MLNSTQQLSKRLQERLEADRQALDQQTSQLLDLHAKSLHEQLNAVRITTVRAMTASQKELLDLHKLAMKKLRWLLLWPLISVMALCLTILLASLGWSWWIVSKTEEQARQAKAQIQYLQQQFCSTPAGRQYCRK